MSRFISVGIHYKMTYVIDSNKMYLLIVIKFKLSYYYSTHQISRYSFLVNMNSL